MSRKTSETVLTELRQLLAKMAPDAGDRLPAERDLTKHVGCSRETLRKALADLEREGEIWRNVGQGTFRGARPRHLPVRDTVLLEGATPPDLMRARLLLEPQVAAEAARRADAGDVVLLRKLVAEGRMARDRTACEQIDDAFHRQVARVSRNPILIGFLTYLSGARRRAAWQKEWDRTYRRLGADEFRNAHGDQHEHIVDCIASTDAISASRAMSLHLETVVTAMAPGKG